MDTRNDLEKFADSLVKQARAVIDTIPSATQNEAEIERECFLWGVVEFRCDKDKLTSHLQKHYDRGREMAHVLTLRHFETGG